MTKGRRIVAGLGIVASCAVLVQCGGSSPTSVSPATEAVAGRADGKARAHEQYFADFGSLSSSPNQSPVIDERTWPAAVAMEGEAYAVIVGEAPLTVVFNLCRSTDPDAEDSLNWQFHFGDDGTEAFNADGSFNANAARVCRVEHTYRSGEYVATLSVSDKTLNDQASGGVARLARQTVRYKVFAGAAYRAPAVPAFSFPAVQMGSLNGSEPTFNRPDCWFAGCLGLSSWATNVFYDVHTMNLPAGPITVNLIGDAGDTYIIMYQTSFSPASPMTNAVAGNDDAPCCTVSQFSGTVPAGRYVFVVTSYAPTQTFNYTLTVTSP